MAPYFSIIIPLYNKQSIIEKTLCSVLSQDFYDYEIIVVNDGSTDKSADIVRSIQNSHITIIEQENGGPSKARNTGTKNAKGNWILFLDADDELMPGTLSKFADLILNHSDHKMFGASYIMVCGEKSVEPYKIKEGYYSNCYKIHTLRKYNYRTGCTIISKDVAFNVPFDENLRRFEDLECFFRMHKYGGMYLSPFVALKQNVDFCEASNGRPDIKEDFIGHLNFKNAGFWKTMSLFRLFVEERERYPIQCRELYHYYYKRYDYLLLYKLFGFLKKVTN